MAKDNIKKTKWKKMDLFSWIMFIIVTLWVLSLILLFYFAVINSLKAATDLYNPMERTYNVFGLPRAKDNSILGGDWGAHFEYYINIFRPFQNGVSDNPQSEFFNFFRASVVEVGKNQRYAYFYELLFYSVYFSVAMTLFSMATEIIVAYCCAKYDFKFKGLLYGIAIFVMIVPIVGSLASELRFAEIFNLKDSVIGICIMRCKYPGLYFLVFYATFKGVSSTYMEAAELDGAGHFQIFFRIMFPLIRTSAFAVFILLYIMNWNDYYTPMVFLSNKPVISFALYNLQFDTSGGTYDAHRLAASICSAIPIIIIFIIFRNKIMGNVTMGGIKG